MSPIRHGVYLTAAVALAMVLTGCHQSSTSGPTGSEDGDTATWDVTNAADLTPESTTVSVAVTRLGCASGITGKTLSPDITYESERIVIRIDVEPFTEGAANCQGNDAVAKDVQLTEPLGQRILVDGGCLRADAADTAPCAQTNRWPT